MHEQWLLSIYRQKQRIDKLKPKTTKHTQNKEIKMGKTTAQYSAVKMRCAQENWITKTNKSI